MVELVDSEDLGSSAVRRVGSSPTTRTINAVGLSQQRLVLLFRCQIVRYSVK